MKFALVAGSILLAAALVLGGQFLIRERSQKQISVIVPELSAEAKNGKIAFETHCVPCHGINASGTDRGPALIDRIYQPAHHGDFSFVRAVTMGVSHITGSSAACLHSCRCRAGKLIGLSFTYGNSRKPTAYSEKEFWPVVYVQTAWHRP